MECSIFGRLLVSFAGKYLSYDSCVSLSCDATEGVEGDASSLHHQLLKISVPQTQLDLFGPAFVEVKITKPMSFMLFKHLWKGKDASKSPGP